METARLQHNQQSKNICQMIPQIGKTCRSSQFRGMPLTLQEGCDTSVRAGSVKYKTIPVQQQFHLISALQQRLNRNIVAESHQTFPSCQHQPLLARLVKWNNLQSEPEMGPGEQIPRITNVKPWRQIGDKEGGERSFHIPFFLPHYQHRCGLHPNICLQ